MEARLNIMLKVRLSQGACSSPGNTTSPHSHSLRQAVVLRTLPLASAPPPNLHHLNTLPSSGPMPRPPSASNHPPSPRRRALPPSPPSARVHHTFAGATYSSFLKIMSCSMQRRANRSHSALSARLHTHNSTHTGKLCSVLFASTALHLSLCLQALSPCLLTHSLQTENLRTAMLTHTLYRRSTCYHTLMQQQQ